MGLEDRIKRLEDECALEWVVLLTEDGEEIPFAGDPMDLVVEQWSATVEGRPIEHPLAPYLDRGLRLKHPERVDDQLWKTLYGEGAARRVGGVTKSGIGACSTNDESTGLK